MSRAATEVDRFIAAVPKVELHLHLVGSASPETLARLAERHPDVAIPTDEDGLRELFRFRDFSHFVEVYTAVNDLVRTTEDVVVLLSGLAADSASHNARYAEVTVTPYLHEMCGLPHGALVEGLDEGRRLATREHGVELAWIYDIPGQYGQPAARRTIDLVIGDPPPALVGFGLAGAEAGVDRRDFAQVFDEARAAGLAAVPHAGEGDGPASVWAAIRDLHAQRIGHGVRSVEDPELVRVLVDRRVPLDVCPSSNVCTRLYPSLEVHPVKQLMDAGVVVTLNTDDPHMFETDLDEEYRRVAHTFGLDIPAVAALVRNGVDAALVPPDRKRSLHREIDTVLDSVSTPASDSPGVQSPEAWE